MKNKQNISLLVTFFIFVIAVVWVGNVYKIQKEQEIKEIEYSKISETLIQDLETLISEKQNATIALAIAFSQNTSLKSSIENPQQARHLLTQFSSTIRQETDFKNAWVQLVDPKGKSLARSWDNKTGDDLSKIRKDVKKMLLNPEIKRSISIGKYDLSFKSMVPVFDSKQDQSFIGFLEIITHFNSIAQNLKRNGIETVILADPKFKKQLTKAWTNTFIKDRYIANLNANKQLMMEIDTRGFSSFTSVNKAYVVDTKSGHLIVNYALMDKNNEALANFLLFKPLASINFNQINEIKININLITVLAIVITGFLILFLTIRKSNIHYPNKANKAFIYTLIFLFITAALSTAFMFHWKQLDSKEAFLKEYNQEITRDYNAITQKYRHISELFLENMVEKPDVLALMQQAYGSTQQKNTARNALLKLLSKEYESLKNYDIRQLHFHLNNNESFLRFHRPEKYGDNLTGIRKTVEWANQYKTPIFGFEEGRIYNGFRNVFPLILNNQLDTIRHLGSVEISFSANAIGKEFAEFHTLKTNFIIKKQTIQEKVFDSEKSNYVQSFLEGFYSEQKIEKQLKQGQIYANLAQLSGLNTKAIVEQINLGKVFSVESMDKSKLITFMPIANPINHEIVASLFFEAENTQLNKQATFFNLLLIGAITLLFLLFAFIYKEFNTLQSFKFLSYKTQRILDSQSAIVIVTDGNEIIEANQSFLNFFGFKNLQSFKLAHKCICHLFEAEEPFFHLGQIQPDQNWINEIKKLNDKDRMVMVIDQQNAPHILLATLNEFGDNVIITFSDITDTMSEQILLKSKSTHDALTQAFNREFFDEIVPLRIQRANQHNIELGFALLDIDHFKQVNDTYGHNTGDLVLKTLVETIQENIRDNDILIRWGGEEFVLLLDVPNKKTLLRIVSQIRTKIENKDFPEVGKVTCSFGVTTYRWFEDINQTIARADKALYQVKNSGRNAEKFLD